MILTTKTDGLIVPDIAFDIAMKSKLVPLHIKVTNNTAENNIFTKNYDEIRNLWEQSVYNAKRKRLQRMNIGLQLGFDLGFGAIVTQNDNDAYFNDLIATYDTLSYKNHFGGTTYIFKNLKSHYTTYDGMDFLGNHEVKFRNYGTVLFPGSEVDGFEYTFPEDFRFVGKDERNTERVKMSEKIEIIGDKEIKTITVVNRIIEEN